MHNKGKRFIFCKECGVRKYCSRTTLRDEHKWTCNKGHFWFTIVGTLEKIDRIVSSHLVPKLRELFERDDTFYAKLKRR